MSAHWETKYVLYYEIHYKNTFLRLFRAPNHLLLVLTRNFSFRLRTVEVTSSTKLIYDFYGFGDEFYRFKYSAPEDKELAQRIVHMLKSSGIASSLDEKRGIDHGTWLPVALMYPDADVPIIQVAVKAGLKFEDQAATGRALAPLIREGYLLIGRYAILMLRCSQYRALTDRPIPAQRIFNA
jgi:aromatic ring-opening dioxygenase catalytic subunit (LigB family)